MQIIDGHILKEVEKTDLINGTFHIPANVDTIERYAFIHSQISYASENNKYDKRR